MSDYMWWINFKFSVSVVLFILSMILIALTTYYCNCGDTCAPIEEDVESAAVSKSYMPTLSTILRDESKNNTCYLSINQN